MDYPVIGPDFAADGLVLNLPIGELVCVKLDVRGSFEGRVVLGDKDPVARDLQV